MLHVNDRCVCVHVCYLSACIANLQTTRLMGFTGRTAMTTWLKEVWKWVREKRGRNMHTCTHACMHACVNACMDGEVRTWLHEAAWTHVSLAIPSPGARASSDAGTPKDSRTVSRLPSRHLFHSDFELLLLLRGPSLSTLTPGNDCHDDVGTVTMVTMITTTIF